MFQKLVAIEPVSLVPSAEKALYSFAGQVVMYPDIPASDDEIIARIGDADAVLLSYTSRINRYVLECCPNVKYIGMCCSLYSPESANVDIRYANERGITVTGIRDYGDEGVVEYVGKSGGMIADALKFFGADISYYARSEKEAATAKGYCFLPLEKLLAESEVICCCLNKNTVLLHEEEFRQMGNRKILFNTGLSPAWDEAAFTEWLEGDNLCFCDTIGALGSEQLLNHPHVRCMQVSTGRTRQAFDRLSAKVLANLSEYNG